MRTLFLLLVCVGAAFAATHVNISIAQHPATNPADVTYVEGTAPAELRAGPAAMLVNSGGEERFARLRSGEESNARAQVTGELKQEDASGSGIQSSQQVQSFSEQSTGANQQQQQKRYYGRLRQQIRQEQFRQANAQDKRNQEFERYIQNYHSGPTVETVFETSENSPSARYSSSASSSSSSSTSSASARLVALDNKPVQQHTFERQVALPATVVTSSSAPLNEQSNAVTDAKIQLSSAPVSSSSSVTSQASMHVSSAPAIATSMSSKPTTTVISGGSDGSGKVSSFGASYGNAGSSSNGVTFRVAGGGGSVGGGYNQPNYSPGNSYAKPEYEQPSYNYNPADEGDLEYPPSVDVPQSGYDSFYSNQERNYQSNAGYGPSNPVYQRPLVTKTIQIAQPALKAKKFEVRHPAIQKEFYDIEERVVIKPAGTIVVELEHPVAKIPKGETVLPLGHPHPAIAAQYNVNSDADIETESSSAGSYNNGVHSTSNQVYATAARKQPAPVVSATQIGSAVTATPTNNQNAKRDYVEANLRKQFGEEAPLVVATTDSQGNQRQITNRNYLSNTFRREENNYQRPARVELKNNEEIYRTAFSRNEEQSLTSDAEDNDDYKGEYVTGNFYSTANKDPKPARLQQAPVRSERITAEPQQMHIIKHEHTIKLPPSQHNIYLAPSNLASPSVLIQEKLKPVTVVKQQPEETAHVQEIKPYLNRQREGVVVYAANARRPLANAQQRYTQNNGHQTQYVVQQQKAYSGQSSQSGQLRYEPNSDADDDASVEYSPSYSHMRFEPKESARFTADGAYNRNVNAHDNAQQKTVSIHYNRGPETYARLVSESKSESDSTESKDSVKKVESKVSGSKSELRPLAHIQLQVPNGQQEADEPIRVMSSIHPPKEQSRSSQTQRKVVVTQQDTNTDDQVEEINVQPSAHSTSEDASRSSNLESKPDCDQNTAKVSARYESSQQTDRAAQVKSLRLIESTNTNSKESSSGAVSANAQTEAIDAASINDAGNGHVTPAGSRVIAANPASSDASAASESFHKRRIVVNHPFQTVREVVEHEPITNYHQIQVHEPASPASAYHKAPYFAPNGALRQFETRAVVGAAPATYPQTSSMSTRGNLVYVLPNAIPVREENGE